MAEICQFSIFQDGGRRQLGFLKLQIINGRNDPERRTASFCQIAPKSLAPRPRYKDFSIFKMAVVAMLIVKNSNF